MENKISGHINEEELNCLLKEAFLGQDFETKPINREALEVVSRQVMRTRVWSPFFTYQRLSHLFNLVAMTIFFFSLLRFFQQLETPAFENSPPQPITNVWAPANNPGTAATAPASELKELENLKPSPARLEKIIQKKHTQKRSVAPASTDQTSADTKKQGKTDSLSANNEVQMAQTTRANSSVVPENTVETDSSLTLSPIPIKQASKTSRIKTNNVSSSRTEPAKNNKKGKTGRRGRGKRLGGNGTFILKGNKYRKSRHI